ncbi:MAG: VanZ family protein [Chloroflexi bacterium]|nr:VanZ family protein [Chloroflexota bacterium]
MRRIVFINIVGNILLFSPIGLTIPLLDTRLKRGWLVVLLGLSFSLVIELAQTFLIHRVFDVDDLILNTFGTLLGFLLYALLSAIHPVRAFFERVREAARPKAFLYAMTFLAFAAAVTLGIYFYGLDQFRQILQ